MCLQNEIAGVNAVFVVITIVRDQSKSEEINPLGCRSINGQFPFFLYNRWVSDSPSNHDSFGHLNVNENPNWNITHHKSLRHQIVLDNPWKQSQHSSCPWHGTSRKIVSPPHIDFAVRDMSRSSAQTEIRPESGFLTFFPWNQSCFCNCSAVTTNPFPFPIETLLTVWYRWLYREWRKKLKSPLSIPLWISE